MTALVGVVMGSDSDLPVMRGAAEMLERFGVSHEIRIVSAHRTPDDMAEYRRTAHERGLRVIIAARVAPRTSPACSPRTPPSP